MQALISRFIRSFRLSIIAMMGLLALVSPVVGVHAGPPASLTASPNPVVIPSGQSIGQFTLSWNSGNGGPIELYGSINGGPDNGPFPGPAVGSSPEQITYGLTIGYKIYTPGKKVLLSSTTVTTARPDKGGPDPNDNSCKEECIRSVTVEPHGTFANFHIITTHPVKVILEATEDGQQNVASATFNLAYATDWQTTLLNLKPGTKYIYTVKATDGASNTKYNSGPFKTLRRQVQVNFTDIHVIDDSDWASAGDLTFQFNVNGKWNDFNLYPSSGEAEINSGDTVHPNHIETIIDAPDGLTLKVHGVDDDCDFAQLCVKGIAPPDDPGGSNDEADWATAQGKTDVALSGLGEEYTDSLTFSTTQFSLKFSVTATYTVSYVP